MQLVVYTTSTSYRSYMRGLMGDEVIIEPRLSEPQAMTEVIHLLHVSSFGDGCSIWLERYAAVDVIAAACSDRPQLKQMLELVKAGARGYCNSYMQRNHYQQMLRLLSAGQSWFPPQLTVQAFELANQTLKRDDDIQFPSQLTRREKQIAADVADGLSNSEIAQRRNISERTVKSHLTHIFKKLDIKDRVALILYLKPSASGKLTRNQYRA